MNLTEIRHQAWAIRSKTSGIYSLFAIPTLLNILFYFLSTPQDFKETLPSLNLEQAFFFYINRPIFPYVISFTVSILFLSATFSMIEVVRKKKENVQLHDIGRIFPSELFSPIFKTLFLKNLLLLFWGIPQFLGNFLSIYTSYKVLTLYEKHSGEVISFSSPEGVEFFHYYSMMLIGIALALAGLVLLFYKRYSYSLAEYILYDKLASKSYKNAWSVLRESRKMMIGYKWKRFLLDLSFIGWYILIFITGGVIGLFIFPYIFTAQILFYEKVKEKQLSFNR